MDFPIYGVSSFIFYTIFTFLAITSAALQEKQNPLVKNSVAGSSNSIQINSNSVLVALLDSHYTKLSELMEKALLLQTLEEAVSKHNITIFAPRNEALERDLDLEFKRFLLEPGNLKSLQNLLLFHMISNCVESTCWPTDVNEPKNHNSLCLDSNGKTLQVVEKNGKKLVGMAKIIKPDDITHPDRIIHGIERVIPKSIGSTGSDK